MCHNASVALDNKPFYVLGIRGIGEIFLAEATGRAKLPDLVLPASDAYTSVHILLPLADAVEGIVYAVESVGYLNAIFTQKV